MKQRWVDGEYICVRIRGDEHVTTVGKASLGCFVVRFLFLYECRYVTLVQNENIFRSLQASYFKLHLHVNVG